MSIKLTDFLENITEEQYRAHPAVSYSSLSKLSNNDFTIFTDKEKSFSKGMSLGTVVDKMIFDEGFDVYKEYNIIEYVPNFNDDNAINRLLFYIQERKLSFSKNDLDDLNQLTKDLTLWDRIKDDEKRIARINIDNFWSGLEYIKLLENGKPFILTEDLMLSFQMVEALKNSDNTKHLFNKSDEFEYIFQPKIFFTVNRYEAKSMLDLIRVDHKNKVIYPADLKTGEPKSFFENFHRFHYPLQASTYTLAISSLIEANEELVGYTIAPFEFIYISRKDATRPKVYDMHPIYIEMGQHGWTSTSGVVYRGVEALISDYYWHISNGIFDKSKEEFLRKKTRINNPYGLRAERRVPRGNNRANQTLDEAIRREAERVVFGDRPVVQAAPDENPADVDFEERNEEEDNEEELGF